MRTKITAFALAGVVSAVAATSASADTIRYQNWSQVPDNSAGVVFHPSNDSRHHVYFLITQFGGPSYVSEFRTSGEEP
jgi:hypothetical protein